MDPTTIAILAAALVLTLDRFGLLERCGLVVKPKSVGDFEGELKLADRKAARLEADKVRLEAEKAAALLKATALEKERSLEPVLDLVARVMERVETMADSQAQVIDKLAAFNGSLAHIRDGLLETIAQQQLSTESLKFVSGLLIELHDLPVKEVP